MSISLPGLSGYDFTSIIASMVQTYKLPENQMITKQNTLQIQQSAWLDVNTRLSSLDSAITALQSAATWTATTATSSNTSFVTATGGSTAIPGNYAVTVANIAHAEVVNTKQTSDSVLALSMPGYVYDTVAKTSNWDFTINGKPVVVTKSSSAGTSPTLTDIVNSINKTQAGVTASLIKVNATDYRISITGNNTGAANQITFADSITGILGTNGLNLNLTAGIPGTYNTPVGSGGISQAAEDALFTVNGVSITSATNTVATAIQGVTLNLVASGASTVTVATDTSVAQKAVQSFVDQYNSTQSFISDKLSYNTTTKKAGDLFADPTLQAIQSRLRAIMGGVINSSTSTYKTLSQVGISTSADNFGKNATLTFDTAKFTSALAANPQSVANLLSAPYNGVTPSNVEGLGNTLHAYLYPAIMFGGSISQTQTSLDSQIKDVTNQISSFDVRVTKYQDMLKAKFASLETLLSGLSSQSTWLTSQINALNGTTTKK
ncbi:flagellar filament capping protein FliD [Desulfitobacterium sp.]|uniref:flagellar filament capping protein FliD n=1 Tax=Desulfitobacterium sp. TaxID=49981 RepID=UPI002C94D88C|nr:flagellar filament capping protein FliD [Desulfitobacterium sp.]HVJ50753.1 flagellar filament capping protein FliD [Desulfitobacterium sp.]